MTPSDVLADFPGTLRASTGQPTVLYRRRPDLIAFHGRTQAPRDIEPVLSLDDPPVQICRLGPAPAPRTTAPDMVSAVYSLAPDGTPAVPTGRVLVRFKAGVHASQHGPVFAREGFAIVEVLAYAPEAAWVRAISGGIVASLRGIPALESLPEVESVEPQMVRCAVRR